MGLCPSRNRKVAKATKETKEEPIVSKEIPTGSTYESIKTSGPTSRTRKLRADAEEYVPLKPVKEKASETLTFAGDWEQFLSVREEDWKNGTKFRRCADGSFTADYQALLKAGGTSAHGKPQRKAAVPTTSNLQGKDMDILAAWKQAKDTHKDAANGWVERAEGKGRRQTPLKKTIIAARELHMDSNWVLQKKFEEAQRRLESKPQVTENHLAMLEELERQASTKQRAKDDLLVSGSEMPFGLADMYACSDTEDVGKSNRHAERRRPVLKKRKYVTAPLSQEVDEACVALLYRLRQLKESERHLGPSAPKRFKFGLREVQRAVLGKDLKALIVAPDLEVVTSAGGLDEKVTSIMKSASAKKPPVPLIFALSRKRLGMALSKSLNISVFAVENTRGAERELQQLFRAAGLA